jgi:hypothetical protein
MEQVNVSGNLIVIGKNNLFEPNSHGELGSRALTDRHQAPV